MAADALFRRLCSPEMLKLGWQLARLDSKDDFVRDPFSYADYAYNFDARLKFLAGQIQNNRYRPQAVLTVDVPKSGLSVRPGNVLPPDEATILNAIVYLLAPLLDRHLSKSVCSYRLHPKWPKHARSGEGIFRESPLSDLPFLRTRTIRKFSPFEPWYEAWPEFDEESRRAVSDGYTHLAKTDISAYFENIDIRLLEATIRGLLKRQEDKTLRLLFRILLAWTRDSSTGTATGRGLPQGNDVSSFLANIFLIHLDRDLDKFCKTCDARWYRYADDVKIFARSNRNARDAIFVVNRSLRELHLTLQGAKTQILHGTELLDELDNQNLDLIKATFEAVKKLDPSSSSDKKVITNELKRLGPITSRFRRGLPSSVIGLSWKENREFRRLMTTYAHCRRPHLRYAALCAIEELPDLRVLQRAVSYLYRLEWKYHDELLDKLLQLVEDEKLLFPFQVGVVLNSTRYFQPISTEGVASRVRKIGLSTPKNEWLVRQKALEAIAALPYRSDHAFSVANKYLDDSHPLVRRAACVLLSRSAKHEVRRSAINLTQHPDPSLVRVGSFFSTMINDANYSQQQIANVRRNSYQERHLTYSLVTLYLASSSEIKTIASEVYKTVSVIRPRSTKNRWHMKQLISRTAWAAN